ncbi:MULTISPECIES: ABC transporter ATP-binding protein [unclassified Lactococcus]|uniref:ABC transporter ATP-binding protein n=1 Tax=unclassified Lactococcus TaxID=2643510 RepID=UPI0011CB6EEA|nr:MULTISPECIES: ABC transporter ATP-binding protein [unclassified Lactococcus]MQW23063.1 ATP-binding cassette domain-containing protein [Lactococcus sp. dk101]TXK44408.1 ABC transporter ATP-binding protein [Lactococcus sp. dk310]TXK50218.1 ABC transporter ATP-binding protein [Lactococcus sp. dk322]
MDTAVVVKELTVKFDGKEILDQLSLELKMGEIVGLIGPSGAGKSTLINAILGMLKVSGGKVEVFEKTMPNRKVMEKIGFMGQSDALFGELTGRQNLEFFGSLQGLSKKECAEVSVSVAKMVNLTDDLDQAASLYSGGMKRRLSLAIALQTDAPLIILDEPTVGIDPELRQEIWQELRNLATKGKSILVTTHVMDEAERCDRVLMLREGHFVAQGSPADLKAAYGVNSIEEAFIKAGQSLHKEAEK